MRRWISTVRPSGRPFETSRRFRSPVEAGSIPYSAVAQPRPLPDIQRGTSSSTLAVQITRVPPASIRHDPLAVRTKPGTMFTSRRSPGERPSLRDVAHAARFPIGIVTSTCSTFPIGSWRNRVPSRRNSSGSPVARKPYAPRLPSSFSSSGLAQAGLDLVGDRLARADDRHAAAQLALQHRADERVVGAAEDHRVDPRRASAAGTLPRRRRARDGRPRRRPGSAGRARPTPRRAARPPGAVSASARA